MCFRSNDANFVGAEEASKFDGGLTGLIWALRYAIQFCKYGDRVTVSIHTNSMAVCNSILATGSKNPQRDILRIARALLRAVGAYTNVQVSHSSAIQPGDNQTSGLCKWKWLATHVRKKFGTLCHNIEEFYPPPMHTWTGKGVHFAEWAFLRFSSDLVKLQYPVTDACGKWMAMGPRWGQACFSLPADEINPFIDGEETNMHATKALPIHMVQYNATAMVDEAVRKSVRR